MRALEFSNAAEPGLAQIGLHLRREFSEHRRDVALDTNVRGLDLVEFRRVDVNVDDLRLRTESGDLARRAVVEAGADGDQQVAFVEREIRTARPVHAQHAERQRVIDRHAAERHQGHHRRQTGFLGQFHRLRRGAGMHNAAAEIEERTLGRVYHCSRLRDEVGVRRSDRIRSPRFRPGADFDALVLHVLRDIDEHRAGTARSRQPEGLWDHGQQLLGRADEEVMLGDRDRHAVDIDLLEGVGTDHRTRHLARDGDERNRVELGVGDRRHQVRRAGTGGSKANCHLTGGARHTLRHEAAALLMARQHVLDLRRLRERIVERQDGAAGDAGDAPDTLSFQEAHNNLCAGQRFGGAWVHQLLLQGLLRLASCFEWVCRVTVRPFRSGAHKEKPPLGLHRRGFLESVSSVLTTFF